MTVISQEASRQYIHSGPGIFPFVGLSALTDVRVYATGLGEGGLDLKLDESEYVVTATEDLTSSTVTLVSPNLWDIGTEFDIWREPPFTQTTHYIEKGPFPAKSHERALDKVTYQVQYIAELLRRGRGILPGPPGQPGRNGWSFVPALVVDGERVVLQVADWVGGTGVKPAVGSYVGAAGLVLLISDAVDIRGHAGDPVDMRVDPDNADTIQWKHLSDSEWIDLITITGGGDGDGDGYNRLRTKTVDASGFVELTANDIRDYDMIVVTGSAPGQIALPSTPATQSGRLTFKNTTDGRLLVYAGAPSVPAAYIGPGRALDFLIDGSENKVVTVGHDPETITFVTLRSYRPGLYPGGELVDGFAIENTTDYGDTGLQDVIPKGSKITVACVHPPTADAAIALRRATIGTTALTTVATLIIPAGERFASLTAGADMDVSGAQFLFAPPVQDATLQGVAMSYRVVRRSTTVHKR